MCPPPMCTEPRGHALAGWESVARRLNAPVETARKRSEKLALLCIDDEHDAVSPRPCPQGFAVSLCLVEPLNVSAFRKKNSTLMDVQKTRLKRNLLLSPFIVDFLPAMGHLDLVHVSSFQSPPRSALPHAYCLQTVCKLALSVLDSATRDRGTPDSEPPAVDPA